MTRRLAAALLSLLLAALALQGARDVVTRVVFPDHAMTFDPLGLLVGRVEASYIPTAVKSIQSGTVTHNAGTGTATIAAVVTANAVLVFDGYTNTSCSTDFQCGFGRLALTNTTTVTGTDYSGFNGAGVSAFAVIEYRSGVLKSVQRGTIALGAAAASGTATITSVNTLKSAAYALGETYSAAGAIGSQFVVTKVVLTNATTVTASRGAQDGVTAPVVGYQVAEFN